LEQGTAILIDQIPLGVLTFSPKGRVEFINQNFHKLGLLYQFNTSLLNINIFKYNLFPPINIIDDLKAVLNGKPFEKEIKNVKTNDNNFISLIVKGSPIYEGDNVSGGMLIIEDLQILTETRKELNLEPRLTDEYINKENIFLIVTDTNGDIKYSAGKENVELNLLRREITGKNISEIFNSPTKQKIFKAFGIAVRNGEVQILDLESPSGDISLKFNCIIEPVIGENGFVQILYLIFKEKTVKEKDTQPLEAKLNMLHYYEEISERKDTGFILINKNGKIINWDEHFEKISGIEKDEGEKLINDLFPSLDPGKLLKTLRTLDDTNSCELITSIDNKKIGTIPVILNFFKSKDDDSNFIIVCTQLKTNLPIIKQQALKPTEPKQKLEEIAQPMCKIDRTGAISFTNQAFNSKLEFQNDELNGKNFFELLLAEKPDEILDELSTLKIGEKKSFPVKIRNKNNTKIDVNLIFEIEKAVNDVPQSFYCLLSKTYDLETKGVDQIYQSFFQASTDGIAIELDEKIIKANNAFAKIFGFENPKELENKNIIELVNEGDVATVSKYFEVKKISNQVHEKIQFLAKKKNGTAFYAEFYIIELAENQKQNLILIAKDITEEKRAQEAAKDSEQKYKNIAENIDDVLYTFERSGNRLLPSFYSSAIEKVTGYNRTEFLGEPRLFLKIIHPDDFHDMKKRLAFLWKSDMQATSEFEFRIINKSGNIVWIRNKINVVRDSEGNIQKVYGLVSDITFNKRAEEELKQSAANLKKLNDAKDRFLSIISHDLRAPFSSILGFTDLLLEDDTLTDIEKQQYITYIQDSSKSMLALVNSMLDWTRLQTGRIKFEPEKINARELIESSINTVTGTALQKGVEIENLVDSSYHIFADKNLILQAFNNLLSNAVKFTKLGDRITITIDTASAARFINFSVKDTGIGIKPGNLDKLFSIETKFTSEGTAGEKGSGLGLSLVKEIIEKHGGRIEVKSEYGKGTEFIFSLPVASTKILLVDPNKRERLFYSKVLINITTDYAVNIVSNGKEALERIQTSPPALVITEHKMPLMSGYTLVQKLIKSGLKEAVPVIVLTDDIDRTAIQEYKELGVEYIFSKPVNLISIKGAIEKSLKRSY
jgi:two-component system sensor histidine kinase/response regulator